MDAEEKIVKLATESAKLCLLPELNRSIGEVHIDAKNFDEFKQILNKNLYLLFDLIQSNKTALFAPTDQTKDFQINLILLICEQTSKYNRMFQSEDQILIQNINYFAKSGFVKLVDDNHNLTDIMTIYKSRLKADNWKKNLGATHGLERFCELYFSSNAVDLNNGMFLLSAGTLFTEYYDHEYKELGIHIFHVLLNSMDESTLIETNVHGAVYQICFHNIQILKDERANICLWKCLLKYVQINRRNKFLKNDPSKWDYFDDILEALIKRIELESNQRIKRILIYFVVKFATVSLAIEDVAEFSDYETVEKELLYCLLNNIDDSKLFDFDNLRKLCTSKTNLSTYRWTKRILNMISDKFVISNANEFEVFAYLHAILVCYITCIYPVPFKLINNQFVRNIEKLDATFHDAWKIYFDKKLMRQIVEEYNKTIKNHAEVASIT